MKKKFRIGIIGTGKFARVHAKAVCGSGNTVLTAVCGSDKDRVRDFSKAYGIKGYVNLDEFLKDPGIDIVDIVNRHDLHAQAAVRSLLSGKDVILEKPMAVTLDAADAIIDACKKTGRKLSVISQHRYDQAYIEAKRIIESGGLGKVIFSCVLMRWHKPEEYFSGYRSWLSNSDTSGGGVLMMQAVHLIDVFTWILGPVSSVRGDVYIKTHRIGVEDTAIASVKLHNGGQGVIMATTSVSRNIMDRLEIHGEKGSIIIEDHRYFEHLRPASSMAGSYFNKACFRISRLLPFNILLRKKMKCADVGVQLRDTIRCLDEGSPLPNPPEEARRVLQSIFAIYNSSKSQSEVLIK